MRFTRRGKKIKAARRHRNAAGTGWLAPGEALEPFPDGHFGFTIEPFGKLSDQDFSITHRVFQERHEVRGTLRRRTLRNPGSSLLLRDPGGKETHWEYETFNGDAQRIK